MAGSGGSRRRSLALLPLVALVGPIAMSVQPAPAATATIRELRIPTGASGAADMTKGPDGNLWFTEFNAAKVARVTTGGTVAEFGVTGGPSAITDGPDGKVWSLEAPSNLIARITPAGAHEEFPVELSYPQGDVEGITRGPDGNVWYTDSVNSKVGRITPGGTTTEFPVPGGPFGITAGPDGALWFTERFAFDRNGGSNSRIGRMTTDGRLTEFPIGWVGGDITTGPDGNLWFTEPFANKIGRMTPGGVVTEYPVPTTASRPEAITAGPDGNVWFTEQFGNRIGRITPAGAITEIHVPTPDSGPTGIATGPDGKIWFTEQFANKVATLDPATVKAPPGPCLVLTRSTVLDRDIGPCPGDGILVTTSNISLNLNGHRVFGTPQRLGDFAGIHLKDVHGVTVRGGTVSGFDAGVWIERGSANSVTKMTLRDNLGAPEGASTLGDGIVLFHSARNRIAGNQVIHNGPFDGIGVLGLGSDHNRLEANLVEANTDDNASGVFGGGAGVIVNPFLEAEDVRRGESLTGNDIVNNVIRHNTSSGSSNLSNLYATIKGNLVERNGTKANGEVNDPGNGIGIQHLFMAQPDTHDLVQANVVRDNAYDGIQVTSEANRIIDNTATGNGNLDLADYNDLSGGPPCDSNLWLKNVWGRYVDTSLGSYYPECVTMGGNGPRPGAWSQLQAAATRQDGAQDPTGRHRSLEPVTSRREGR